MPDCPRCGSQMLHPILDECQPGDIQARALYTPTRKQGLATGRLYPRTMGQGQILCVAPADIALSPDWWKVDIDPQTLTPDTNEIMHIAGLT